ncbi:MAG: DUF2214 family protein [Planctomycetes bacterium]|nr:DUF2214 family protein [Planctomycetota bacterium]
MAFAIGLAAIHFRARLLGSALDAARLRLVFKADTYWAVAGVLWLATGPWRAFGPVEKGTAFYMGTWLFHLKLTLFVVVLLLEIRPMLTLLRWRRIVASGGTPDTSKARVLAIFSHVELTLVVLIALVASFMARGFGQRTG